MIAYDVVLQLIKTLPFLTDAFTESVNPVSVTSAGTTATVTTATDHGLLTGNLIAMSGSDTAIELATMIRTGNMAILTTASDHDYTENHQEVVILDQGNQALYNDSFRLIRVPNRRTIHIDVTSVPMATPIPTTLPLAMNGESYGYNGVYPVTVVDATTFTYTIPNAVYSPAFGTPKIHTSFRISAAISGERALAAYTQQEELNDLWCFVVLGNVSASKSRALSNDLTYYQTGGQSYQQKIIQPFSIFIIQPTKSTIAARTQRDTIEELTPFIFRSVLGARFNTQLYARNQYQATFVQHGIYNYTTAVYAHVFEFEMLADAVWEDTVGEDFNVAFRDIDLTQEITQQVNGAISATQLTAAINLDDEPL